MGGYFSEKALQHYAAMVAQSQYADFTEGEIYDFTRCVRPDGSIYGTRGKCRKGKETDEKPDNSSQKEKNDNSIFKSFGKKLSDHSAVVGKLVESMKAEHEAPEGSQLSREKAKEYSKIWTQYRNSRDSIEKMLERVSTQITKKEIPSSLTKHNISLELLAKLGEEIQKDKKLNRLSNEAHTAKNWDREKAIEKEISKQFTVIKNIKKKIMSNLDKTVNPEAVKDARKSIGRHISFQ